MCNILVILIPKILILILLCLIFYQWKLINDNMKEAKAAKVKQRERSVKKRRSEEEREMAIISLLCQYRPSENIIEILSW